MKAGTALAYVALVAMPFLFATNMIIGRYAAHLIEPWTLAFLRWFFASAILAALTWRDLVAHRAAFVRLAPLLFVLGLIAMWLCGGLVYVALHHTTATNGSLIYATAAVFVLLIEWAWLHKRVSLRDIGGVVICLFGVMVILGRGNPESFLSMQLNVGDLIFLVATIAWAVYTLSLKRKDLAGLPTMALFTVIAIFGMLSLAPFALWEIISTGHVPVSREAWLSVLGVALVPSVMAYSAFQFGLKVLGARAAAMFSYLLIPAGVLMAWGFLGEQIEAFHATGTALILVGIVLATAPTGRTQTA